MSCHHLTAKPLNATLNAILKRAAHVGLGVGAFTPMLALANPTGGQVVAGQANISTPNANNLVVKQASQSAIINWQQFSIDGGQYVQFLQPSSSSVVLNRVVGGNATSILGNLSANGQVFLVNPNGIFFGKGASLDVQGIVASTLDISNSDFLAGNYVFDKGSAPDGARVVNQGNIRTRNGGYVVLAGDYSENDGLIQAQSGHVVLASGAKTTLTLSGNRFVNFAVDEATLSQLAGAKNAGSLLADGGTVIMTADVANELKATVVNNTGLIEAQAITKGAGGIYLSAEGGNIVNAGTLDADAGRAGVAGGTVQLKGDGVTDLTATSKISALGNGADGGHLEVSGRTVNVRGTANLGQGGRLLLDPGTMSISTGNKNSLGSASNNTSIGHIGVSFIDGQLNNGVGVTISAANLIKNSANMAGHSISAMTNKAAGATLALKAHTGNIELSGVAIKVAGALTASFGYGSFGFIQAKSVAFTEAKTNGSGSVALHAASTSVHGAVTRNSIKTTGGDIIFGADTNGIGIYAESGTGPVALNATGNVNLNNARVGEQDSHNSFIENETLDITGKSVTMTGVIRTGSGDVNITATGGNMVLGNVNAAAVNLTGAAGNITAGLINAGGSINITDTTGNVTLQTLDAAKNVTVNAKGHTLSFASNGYGYAGSNLTLTAATITQTGSELNLTADTGNLTVKGQISLPSNHSGSPAVQVPHNLQLYAGNTITLNRGIAVPGTVSVIGPHLAYTGGNSFTVSAADGNLYLDAAIGSSAAAAKYNVNLKDKGTADGGAIFIQKDIYTGTTAGGLKANITATETGYGSGAPVAGVLVGNSYGGSEVVSAAGNITLKGWNAAAGGNIPGISGIGAVTVKAGQNITFSASGNGSKGGNAAIQASNAAVSGAGGYRDNTSVLVQAEGNIKLSGENVVVQAGKANVSLSVSHGYGTASANVTLKANGNVNLFGGKDSNGRVVVAGGSSVNAGLNNAAFGGETLTEKASGNVSITAKNNVNLTGQVVAVQGGWGRARASAGEGSASMSATASADVSLTATRGTITLTGGSAGNGGVQIHGGSHSVPTTSGSVHYGIGQSGGAFAQGDSLKAVAATHADVSFTAGNAITLSGRHISVQPGNNVGRIDSNSSRVMAVKAVGSHASASDTVTANIGFNAGAGGIALTGIGSSAGVHVEGGSGLGRNASVSAAGIATKADYTAKGKVTLTTTGNVSLSAPSNISMVGGASVARYTKAEASYGSATISDDAGVGITASTVTLQGKGVVSVIGGDVMGWSATALAGHHGEATLQAGAAVNISAQGAISINGGTTASSNGVVLNGGGDAGYLASADGKSDGTAKTEVDASLNLQANAIKITSPNAAVVIGAGNGAAWGAEANASGGALASMDANASIKLTAAAGGIVLTGKLGVRAQGGLDAAAGLRVFNSSTRVLSSFSTSNHSSQHTKYSYTRPATAVAKGAGAVANLTGDASLTLTATHGGGLVINQTSTASGGVGIGGGLFAAHSAAVTASYGGVASLSGKSNVTINAGTVSVTGHNVNVFGGQGGAFGGQDGYSSQSTFGVHSGVPFTNGPNRVDKPAPAVNAGAIGPGAKAALSADASVAITATAIALTATGSDISLSGGWRGAQGAHVHAASGGSAQLSAKSSLTLTAAGAITAQAAGRAFVGAAGGEGSAATVQAMGSHAIASLVTDGSVALTAGGTVKVVSTNQNVAIHGEPSAALRASVNANSGGQANLTALDDVSLQGGAVKLGAANGSISIAADYRGPSSSREGAAYAAHVNASNAQAMLDAQTNVNISGGAGGITMTAKDRINVRGGQVARDNSGNTYTASSDKQISGSTMASNSRNEHIFKHFYDVTSVRAMGTGSAQLTGSAGVSLTTTKGGAITLTQTNTSNGKISIAGGASVAGSAVAAASGDATATLTAKGGVTINGGVVTLTGRSVEVVAGNRVAAGRNNFQSSHSFSGKTAGVSYSSASFGTGLVRHQPVQATGTGAKAALNADASVSITGTAVSLNAINEAFVSAGYGAALNGYASAASGGSAALMAKSQVSLTATAGALTVSATNGYIGIGNTHCCSAGPNDAAAGALAAATRGTATVTVDGGIALSGKTAVTLIGGSGVAITAASGPSAAGASAGFKGQATVTDNLQVSIVTPGTFTVQGGGWLELKAARGFGGASGSRSTSGSSSRIGRNYARATGAGAVANFTSDGSLNINAGSVKLKAGNSAGIVAGSHVGDSGMARASYAGVANYSANRDVNIDAVNGVLIKLTSNTASSCCNDIYVDAGYGVGFNATAVAGPNGGKANLTASADVNIDVSRGGVTLDASKHKNGNISVAAGANIGHDTSSSSRTAGVTQATGRGGSANALLTANLNLTAAGAIAMNAGASGDLNIYGGGKDGVSNQVLASGGGKATNTIQGQAILNGGSVTLTAGGNITVTAASQVGVSAGVNASSGGVAKLNITTGTQITAKAGFTATAGGRMSIDASGSSSRSSNRAGGGANVLARGGRAQATMTVADATRINAGSVNVNAGTSLEIYGGWEVGESAHVKADTRNDVATLNLDGSLDITATGGISLTAKDKLQVSGGGSAGRSAGISIGFSPGSHVKATGILNINAGVNLKAGGAFTAAGSIVHFGNGADIGHSFGAGAFGSGNVAKASLTDGVSVTAASIALTGANGVTLQVGSLAGLSGGAFAIVGAKATTTATDAISLDATGNVFITANTGDVDVSGGGGDFIYAPIHASAGGSGADATIAVQGGVDITAGGNLKLNAKKGGVQVEGGNGVFGSVNAASGSASVDVNAGVDLKAGRSMTVNAGGGSIALLGGSAAGLFADVRSFGPPVSGNVTGTLATGVTASAGSNVTLQATHSVTVAAGAGETVAVGKPHVFSPGGGLSTGSSYLPGGNSWHGGTAILSEDQSATVTAGKLLTVTAGAGTGGSGNIVVRALGPHPGESAGFFNVVTVHGGSSAAFGSVSVNANAQLTGASVTLNAARVSTVTGPSHQGNLSIDGGSFYDVRADHTKGVVTITGNANAGITATTGNVTLNAIGGSVNVAGGGYSDNSRLRLVDAHGDSGSASVTAHADAAITAGHDIVTVNALGGGLNVTAGKLLAVAAVGSAGSGALQEATGTANASLAAGDVINISGAGDLNLLGGLIGKASALASVASASASVGHHNVSGGRRDAAGQMKSTVSGTNGVTLTFGGDGVIAAGDGMTANAVTVKSTVLAQSNSTTHSTTYHVYSANQNSVGANFDASTTVSGKNITLKVGGNLLVRAGSGDVASGDIYGNSNSAVAATQANLNLNATGNISVTVGKGTVGNASFVAGNVPTVKLQVHGGNVIYSPSPSSHIVVGHSGSNALTGNVNADLNVTAGGNITLNVHGNLAVTGGQAVGASGYALAGQPYSFGTITPFTGDNGVAVANISSKTTFKSGGNTSVTLHGGTVTLAGGYQAASQAVVDTNVTRNGSSGAGTAAKAVYNLDASLNMTAGGALTITGAAASASGVVISTQVSLSSTTGPYLFPAGSHARASVTGNSSVTLSGKTLSINGGHFSTQSAGTVGSSSPGGSTSLGSSRAVRYGPNSVFLDGRIKLLQNGLPLMSVAAPLSVSVRTLDITPQTLEVAPQHTGVSFGVPVNLSSLPSTSPLDGMAPQASVTGSTVTQATDGVLGTLQSTGLVVNLVSVVSGGAASASNPATAFDPALSLVPTATGSGAACTAFVRQSSGAYRCGSGGR